MKVENCPFCIDGGNADVFENVFDGQKLFSVACGKCGASTPAHSDKKVVIEVWNKRADLVSENKEGLISCPCCAGNAHVSYFEGNEETYYGVFCDKCCVSGPCSTDEQEAINLWNTRHEN